MPQTRDMALQQLDTFCKKWDSKYPTIAKSWQNKWSSIAPCLAYPEHIKKVIYTTKHHRIHQPTDPKKSLKAKEAIRKFV